MTNNADLTYRAFVDISDQALMYADRPDAVVVAAMNRLTQTMEQRVGWAIAPLVPRECTVRVNRVDKVYGPLGSEYLFDGIRITADARYDPLPRPRWVRQHYGGRYHAWHRTWIMGVGRTECGRVDMASAAELQEWDGDVDRPPATGRVCKRCADRCAV